MLSLPKNIKVGTQVHYKLVEHAYCATSGTSRGASVATKRI